MEETARHPLAIARIARGMRQETLAAGVRAAARRRGLRSGTDKARIRKWERGVEPNAESQMYIAEALDLPDDTVRVDGWPIWLPSTADGVVPLGPHSFVPALREARSALEANRFARDTGVTYQPSPAVRMAIPASTPLLHRPPPAEPADRLP